MHRGSDDQWVYLVSPESLFPGPVEAISVAFMVNALGSMTAASGALAGFMLWLGFVAPTNLVNKLFAGQGLKVWAIEAGNHLPNLLLFGGILGA